MLKMRQTVLEYDTVCFCVITVHRFFRISLSLNRKGYAIMTISADYFSREERKECSDM